MEQNWAIEIRALWTQCDSSGQYAACYWRADRRRRPKSQFTVSHRKMAHWSKASCLQFDQCWARSKKLLLLATCLWRAIWLLSVKYKSSRLYVLSAYITITLPLTVNLWFWSQMWAGGLLPSLSFSTITSTTNTTLRAPRGRARRYRKKGNKREKRKAREIKRFDLYIFGLLSCWLLGLMKALIWRETFEVRDFFEQNEKTPRNKKPKPLTKKTSKEYEAENGEDCPVGVDDIHLRKLRKQLINSIRDTFDTILFIWSVHPFPSLDSNHAHSYPLGCILIQKVRIFIFAQW